MVTYDARKMYYSGGSFIPADASSGAGYSGKEGTMAYSILSSHNTSGCMDSLKIKFDAMASHDITYVGIIQTARASGLDHFPIPYVLTNCHNSLCAVGGTINEDDHLFGHSAAVKYGGEFVPAHMAVIHQYMRENYAGCGKMILASDSHTRYGALGALSVGEGGPELVKQLLGRTYDISYPDVVAVELTGSPRPGVGPQDVAIALVGAVFKKGLVKNKILEFVGPGIKNLGMDYRNGIDVMTTETTCLSSIWETDEITRAFLAAHGREEDYRPLHPQDGALYDAVVHIDLDKVEPMIALPFHPSNAYTIREFKKNAAELLHEISISAREKFGLSNLPDLADKVVDGVFRVDQGVIAGCSGGLYENLCRAADILDGGSLGHGGFSLSVYPASQPMQLELMRRGVTARLMQSGAVLRSAFCGPCFGAGDVPGNAGFSIRHSTRNFENREGSKPGSGQLSYVALMDARSIAATAAAGGVLTGADELKNPPADRVESDYHFDSTPYTSRVYRGVGNPQQDKALVFGPNIADWPEMIALPENLVLTVASAIYDEVTTTDELIPSGETSSYRSNPEKLSSFALSRKDPQYVGRAKAIREQERLRREGNSLVEADFCGLTPENTGLGTLVCALRPGDGSAREQAASCQRVLGGVANIASEYATKRYRSNLINWGMLPFILDGAAASEIAADDRIILRGIRSAVESGAEEIAAELVQGGTSRMITLKLPGLTAEERKIILAGCLINYYSKN